MQARLLSRREAVWQPAAPFDVPAGDESVGLRREGDALIGVLAVAPASPTPIVIGAPRPDRSVVLTAVAEALAMHDAAPFSVDVVSHTMGCRGASAAARSYRGLLGGVRVAAHRSVHIVVRMRPAAYPAAVRARGGEGAGTLRTALWCLRRLRASLADAAVVTRPLTAAEITELTARLTEGIPVTTAESSLVSYCLPDPTPESLAALLAAPVTVDAISTTVTVTVAAGPSLRVMVRDNGGRGVDRSGEFGLARVAAPAQVAATAGLPISPPPTGRRDLDLDDAVPMVGSAVAAHLCAVPVPLAGDGQLIGADITGRPVALRLAGRDIPRCDVAADPAIARQTVARLAALGFAVAVASDDPRSWHRLAETVGVRFWAADRSPRQAHVLVDDTPGGAVSAPPGVTLLRVHRPGETSPPGSGPALRRGVDGVTLHVDGSGRSVEVRPVSTDAERALIGP